MSNDFHHLQVLECPSCGASLALPDADSFTCDYCGKLILVPPELRPKHPAIKPVAEESVFEALPPQRQPFEPESRHEITIQPKRTNLVLVLAISTFVLITGIVLFLVALVPANKQSSGDALVEITSPITPLPTMVQFARLEMVFGGEGKQPGQFEDARTIAVDPQGNIFVADYTSGRINKFDADGKFLQLIQLQSVSDNADIYIMAIATDATGGLYVASGGEILKFDTTSGKLIATIPDRWPEIYYNSVVVAPDGNLYATNGMAGADDIIILSPEGELLAHWTDTIENVNHDDPAVQLAVGVNHAGMVYILSPNGNQVYAYNPDGTFSFSFGEPGEHAGQFDLSTGMLAITAKDYLVISDVFRVDLYDADGKYLNRNFTVDYNVAGGSMFGMTIDANGDLYYISSGSKVLKFDINYP